MVLNEKTGSEAVRVEDLTYIYSAGTPFESIAVDHINLTVNKGEFVGVIGHTGSGKSTLMQHLNGLLKPTSGKVYINGRDIWEEPKKIRQIRFKVGVVFQYPEYQLFEETVYRDIAYGPGNMGLSADEVRRRVLDAVEFVQLPVELLERSPFELSGGQKRRAAIAGIMAMKPEIIIFDEPTAGLDPEGRDRLLKNITDYHEKQGVTVLLVSHSMEDIARVAQRIVVLRRGGIAMQGTVEEVFGRAEEITAMGLAVPQITRLFLKLRARGLELPASVYTTERAAREIAAMLEKKRVRPSRPGGGEGGVRE